MVILRVQTRAPYLSVLIGASASLCPTSSTWVVFRSVTEGAPRGPLVCRAQTSERWQSAPEVEPQWTQWPLQVSWRQLSSPPALLYTPSPSLTFHPPSPTSPPFLLLSGDKLFTADVGSSPRLHVRPQKSTSKTLRRWRCWRPENLQPPVDVSASVSVKLVRFFFFL